MHFTKCHFHIQENIKTEGGGTEDDKTFSRKLAHTTCPTSRENMKKKFRRTKKTSKKVKDYFKTSLYPESTKWVVNTMPGEKEGLFSCQPSESFHNAIKKVKIRECPMVYIPEMIIIREHNQITKEKRKYQDLIDHGKMLPKNLMLDIEWKSNLKPSQYAKSRTKGNGISGNVTNKHHKFQVTHQINLSNSPPTCSNGCLRLYGTPCSEMCVYSNYTNQDIIALLPDKYKSQCQHHLLDLSLPDNHPALNIDNDSLSILHDPIILPPFSKAPRGRPHSKRLEKGHRVQRKHNCQKCGLSGHHKSTCTNPTDGLGHYMQPNTQKKSIGEGFLVIPISTPSLTKLPTSLSQFHEMRAESLYPTMIFVRMHLIVTFDIYF